jgi:prepilin-type N-terminal cleavage/methylation domain-containing protein
VNGSRQLYRRGFTLIEAALAIVIVGVGVVGVMQLFLACSQQNAGATKISSATLLATHLRETLEGLPFTDPTSDQSSFGVEPGESLTTYDDIDDFNGLTFSPPIDINREPLSGFEGVSQRVRIVPVSANKLDGNVDGTAISDTTYTGAARITIQVLASGGLIYELSWLRMDE